MPPCPSPRTHRDPCPPRRSTPGLAGLLASVAVAGAVLTAADPGPLEAAQDSAAAQPGATDRFDRVAGISATGARQFFQRLRAAVGRDERRSACEMLAYPLAHPDGPVADASQCEARYESVFTVPVRRAIGKQIFDEVFVNQQGVMIGLGEAWIAGRCAAPPCAEQDLRVIAINQRTEGLTPPQGKVLLGCRANGTLLHVSADGAGGAELRMWRSGRSTGTPETVVAKAADTQHDDLCDARSWTFIDGTTRYRVSTLACDAHLTPPPMGAVGELLVTRPGMEDVRLWCDQ